MKEKKTQIKICGLTRPEEVGWILEENADYFGIVLFFPKSRRNNSIANAKKLLAFCHEEAAKMRREAGNATAPKAVAVTVSPTPEQIREIEDAGFDMIQIHGEFSDETLEAVSLPVIRAVPVSDIADRENGRKYDDSPKIEAYLFDAQSPGSGQTFDWSLLDNAIKDGARQDNRLVFLAGGLNCDNVREAIQNVHPDVVDVSSGVEKTDVTDKGAARKDREKIREFIRKVRADE